MVEMGYDARGMASMFTTLGRYGSHQGGGRTPEWASTHPDPANRVAVTNMRIASLAGDPRRSEGQSSGIPRPDRRDHLRGEPEDMGTSRRRDLSSPR